MTLSVVIVILLFSIVQSVIGVGILLFGTPTLLLMGYSYHETLYLILPSSILISFLQTASAPRLLADKKYIYVYTLPMILLGLLVVTSFYDSIHIKHIVGAMLLLIGVIRSFPFIRLQLNKFLCKNRIWYHIIMGAVHGVSNMGGGMLVVLMSSVHEKRGAILANIAYVYLLFGLVQIITLQIFSEESANTEAFFLALLALMIYKISIKFIVGRINDMRFDSLTTLLIVFYGIISFINIG